MMSHCCSSVNVQTKSWTFYELVKLLRRFIEEGFQEKATSEEEFFAKIIMFSNSTPYIGR